MPKKLMRCYRKVKAKGTADNPMAVCIKSTGQKPKKHKKKR
jgi:hypothetical protein